MGREDKDPILCPDCGGTGMHPWKACTCRKCNGTGELDGETYDERYKITRYRGTSGCHGNA